MDLFSNLANGFQQALTLSNLFYGLIGCVLGTLIGVLPGLGPVATLAMLLPVTYILEPTTGIIMLAGIYYGAQYGGSTTAILVNMPGESSSVVTAIDGYEMTRRGRAGSALAMAAMGSFFAGCVGTLLIGLFAPQLARVAFEFGPVDYFALMCLGLVGAITLANGDFLKSVVMIVVGLMLGLVGADLNTGTVRYTFGMLELEEGIEFVALAMALYGFGEILINLGPGGGSGQVTGRTGTVESLLPSRQELRQSAPAVLRGSLLGSVLGVLPGGGAALASFASYGMEKEMRLAPGEIPVGRGNIRGVAGPEAANNAAAQTSFIPMLTLGIPSTSTMALLMAALSVHDIQVGPQILTKYADLFWALVASMLTGNLILLVLNYPLIAIWVRLLLVPYRLLFPAIILVCLIGVYCISYSVFPIFLLILFVPLGYLLKRLGYEGAPLLLGFILGPQMEISLRRSLTLSEGSWMTFVQHPMSAGLLALTVVFMLVVLVPKMRRNRRQIFQESEQ